MAAPPSFDELFPEIPCNERDEARDNFDRYVRLAISIFEDAAHTSEAEASPLTPGPRGSTMKSQRSKQEHS